MSTASFLDETNRILKKANENDLALRLLGAAAIVMHSPKFARTFHESSHRELSDLDFIAHSRQNKQIRKLFGDLGYSYNKRLAALYGRNRLIFSAPKFKADVFFDKLEFCHTINLANRFDVDYPTISLADLLLEKIQIVQITEKDIIDTIILLREHNVGNGDKETVNIDYIAKLMASDWGFYYTMTTNLKKLNEILPTVLRKDEDRANVRDKINIILNRIEVEPKSIKWKMRAKIGTRKKWYNEVEDVVIKV